MYVRKSCFKSHPDGAELILNRCKWVLFMVKNALKNALKILSIGTRTMPSLQRGAGAPCPPILSNSQFLAGLEYRVATTQQQ